jgi:hypothetical protein
MKRAVAAKRKRAAAAAAKRKRAAAAAAKRKRAAAAAKRKRAAAAAKKRRARRAQKRRHERTNKHARRKNERSKKRRGKKHHTKKHRHVKKHAKYHVRRAGAVARIAARLTSVYKRLEKKHIRKIAKLRREAKRARANARKKQYSVHTAFVRHKRHIAVKLARIARREKMQMAMKNKHSREYVRIIKSAKLKGGRPKSSVRKAIARVLNRLARRRLKKLKAKAVRTKRKWAAEKRAHKRSIAIVKLAYAKKMKQIKRSTDILKRQQTQTRRQYEAHFRKRHRGEQMKWAKTLAKVHVIHWAAKQAAKRQARREKLRAVKENRLKHGMKKREVKSKHLAKLRMIGAAKKERFAKLAKRNEAHSKYRRKKQHAERMKKSAQRAKRQAERSAKTSEKSSKAEEKTTKAALKADATVKSCSFGECLKGGKCHKTGGKYHLSETDFVSCTTKKAASFGSLGSWAGTPFKDSNFPETKYSEPAFSMPKMPIRI